MTRRRIAVIRYPSTNFDSPSPEAILQIVLIVAGALGLVFSSGSATATAQQSTSGPAVRSTPAEQASTQQEPGSETGDDVAETSRAGPSPDDAETPAEYCRRFLEPHVRSSARKLYRALSGRVYSLRQLDLSDQLEIEASSGSPTNITFDVYREGNGKVVGLVDAKRNHRRTFVVLMSASGPIIASHRWPKIDAIDARTDCQPISSRIDYPTVTVARVDPEPFKFWGLRVTWRLPKSLDGEGMSHDKGLTEALSDLISSDRE